MSEIIYLEDKRREMAEWVQKIQHLFGGIPLLFSGIHNLAGEAERAIGIVEIAVAVVLMAAFVKELRSAHKRHHSKVGWFDLAAGGLLIFEAFHGAHHKPGYLRPQFLAGLVTIAVGAFHAKIHRARHHRRYVKLDDHGVELRISRFSRTAIPWAEIANVELHEHQAVFQRKDGRSHALNLKRYHNREQLREGIARMSRIGLPACPGERSEPA